MMATAAMAWVEAARAMAPIMLASKRFIMGSSGVGEKTILLLWLLAREPHPGAIWRVITAQRAGAFRRHCPGQQPRC